MQTQEVLLGTAPRKEKGRHMLLGHFCGPRLSSDLNRESLRGGLSSCSMCREFYQVLGLLRVLSYILINQENISFAFAHHIQEST